MDQAGVLLSIAALHLVLTALPGFAGISVAVRRGARDIPILLAVGMASIGLAAYVSFWSYFLDASAGRALSVAIVGVSLLVVIRSRTAFTSDVLKGLATPGLLWALSVGFLLFLGFLHGGTEDPLVMARMRFSHGLPDDNALPWQFAEPLFMSGHDALPYRVRDWLSSDRPPLQIGFVVAQRPFGWDARGLHYQVIGVILQQMWILGMWALLVAARVRVDTRASAMVAVLLSDLAIVNGFFVWPKMLAAAYLLAATAFILTDRWSAVRRHLGMALLVAALIGLAMLAHGATVFGILALACVAVARGLPTFRWLATGVVTGLLLLLPWTLYQRYVDPPGNRLVKWLIAGVAMPDGRGTLQAVVDSYSAIGIRGALEHKGANYLTLLGRSSALVRQVGTARFLMSGQYKEVLRRIRGEGFYFFLQSLGVFAVAPVLMLMRASHARRHPEDWKFAVGALQFVFFGCLFWGLLIFDRGFTIIATGSLAFPAVAMAACVAGLCASMPRLARWLVGVHALTALVIYAPALDPLPGTLWSKVAAASLVAFLLCFVLLAFRPLGRDIPEVDLMAPPAVA